MVGNVKEMTRRFFGFLAVAINTALGIIALGLILRVLQKLFLLGWEIL